MNLLNRRPTSPSVPAGSGYSLFDAQLVVIGDVETSGSLRIDGRMEGNVRRADMVVLGVGASMTGDIHGREVVVGGTLTGSVFASERVELQATAIVMGDLVTQSVLVQEGGVVNGRVLMQPPKAATANHQGPALAPNTESAAGAASDHGVKPVRR